MKNTIEKKSNDTLKILVPLADLKDSMLMDSGQDVITINHRGYDVSVRVCGEVRVDYKGSRYAAACQMPEDLLAKFRDGSAYSDPDVNVIDNNWFEAFIDKDGQWTGSSSVIDDFDGESEEDVAKELVDMVDECVVDEAMDLLKDKCKTHGLEGVEFTREDALRVADMAAKGHTLAEAADIVLEGIRRCLDEGL